ncbi:hypothetical protein EV421DRAFT_1832698 [Armillaria borealis]|uniref:Uncharacterized protein n=1 Tax=Armillaria borealis TaxID=47425 RepID=A0AA39J5W7_9AGAR|nr:hypothetical protein EV421DRAFT_1832698 [Armillaria borealis]
MAPARSSVYFVCFLPRGQSTAILWAQTRHNYRFATTPRRLPGGHAIIRVVVILFQFLVPLQPGRLEMDQGEWWWRYGDLAHYRSDWVSI